MLYYFWAHDENDIGIIVDRYREHRIPGGYRMRVSSVDEMRDMDRRASGEYDLTEELLMENAGRAAYELVAREIGTEGRRFAVACGTGNNGGDGLVVARALHSAGAEVAVFTAGGASKYKGAALSNYRRVVKAQIPVRAISDGDDAREALSGFDVIVDGLFGTGLSRNVDGIFADSIRAINGSGAIVVSLDIPSGIHGETGMVLGSAVKADYTIAFGLPKTGNLLYPGYAYSGRLFVSHISFPPALYDDTAISVETNEPVALPVRDPSGHKGSFGDALFVAGAAGYLGAPGFAASAHLSGGGGYSRLAAPRSIVPHLATRAPEVVYVPLPESSSGSVNGQCIDQILDVSSLCDVVVIGPGLSLDPETRETVRLLVQKIEKPLVIDGDGITAVSIDPSILLKRKHPTVLTPHPGEMSMLAGIPVREIECGRIRAVRETAKSLSSIVVLKGAHSLVGMADGRVYVNLSGNSGMATAGSGDVLTGAITAMFGLGLGIGDAVRNAVFVHGLAGDIAAKRIGEDGVRASDILASLPEAVRALREDYGTLVRDSYEKVRLL